MAMNPMQKKARTSFLLGMLLTLVITGLIIGFLVYQLMQYIEAEESIDYVSVYVLNQDVSSGQVLTADMFTLEMVDASTVPENATSNIVTTLASYTLCDTEGRSIYIRKDTDSFGNEQTVYYIKVNGEDKDLYRLNSDGEEELVSVLSTEESVYYYDNYNKVYITTADTAAVAKVALNANTVITTSLIQTGEATTSDLRLQEYNMILLPTYLTAGEYVDIRLRLPSGEDYIVLSKKYIENTNEDTIWINVSEDEILTMSNAIVEAYIMDGSLLYATTYTEAGIQDASTPTYVPSSAVISLMNTDPNITDTAMNELSSRYSDAVRAQRTTIQEAVDSYDESATDSVSSGTEEEVTTQQEARQSYISSLTATDEDEDL